MQTQPAGTAAAVEPLRSAGPTVRPALVTTVATALALGAATVAGVLLWQPWTERDDFAYDAVEPVRDAAWAGSALDGFGFAVACGALSVLVCLVAAARGARWAHAGAVLTTLGGMFFAAGIFAFGALGWYATSTDALSAGAGAGLLTYVEDHPERVAAPQLAGFLLTTVGLLLLATALGRARAVPRWLPVALAVLTVGQFAPVPSRGLDLIQVVLMAVLVASAWYLRRAALRP
ncbi:hypothetical protein AB0M28_08835 [Streptomyces sp. NPDC051940]|uniref:hypothetical protein n=1 Tax=Streptomyces sp. NPDC051940 TaxID=3155675 RepID=UPI003440FCB6